MEKEIHRTARNFLKNKHAKEMVRFILDKYTKLDTSKPSDRETIVEGLVGSVFIFGDGRVIITFNYRGEPVESTIDEIIATANSGSDLDCSAPPTKKRLLSTRQKTFF